MSSQSFFNKCSEALSKNIENICKKITVMENALPFSYAYSGSDWYFCSGVQRCETTYVSRLRLLDPAVD